MFSPDASALNDSEPTGHVTLREGERGFQVDNVDALPPFLVSLLSDGDHWMFLASNGALTAGRKNPDHALFPYYTQDKLLDMAGSSGCVSAFRQTDGSIWRPFDPTKNKAESIERTFWKSETGNRVIFTEVHRAWGLRWTQCWRPSRKFGFVRRVTLQNTGDEPLELETLDGVQNILAPGLPENFQNRFSILGDAYKTASLDPSGQVAAFALSSIPSDGALPMEGLAAHVVWHLGWPEAHVNLSQAAVRPFLAGEDVSPLPQQRGLRPAYLLAGKLTLLPGEQKTWYLCADVEQPLGAAQSLALALAQGEIDAQMIEADCDQTADNLRKMLAEADGLQQTADDKMALRHASNTMFNLMRGGRLPTGYQFPPQDLPRHVALFNPQAGDAIAQWEASHGALDLPQVMALSADTVGPDAARLAKEYLPLTFSRRHGDPSRPWNRFSIEIEDSAGASLYRYQGNWRDIFQNWEALLQSYPRYLGAAVRRFLNASTADGYNPYRITKDGVDWEVPEPHDPWANLGYWGDHQIIYLLRLLEAQEHFFPGEIAQGLEERAYVYLEIPYRLHAFREMLRDPRETITYDEAGAERIAARVENEGEDGKLLHHQNGEIVYLSLLEKLLVPLLAKMSNFVPGGGIWMNTQRPEWNDANNALVGYGVSVVTAGYCLRYAAFLEKILAARPEAGTWEVTAAVASLLATQRQALGDSAEAVSPAERLSVMTVLGTSASAYRQELYEGSFAEGTALLDRKTLLDYLQLVQGQLRETLKQCQREDGLYESYQLLAFHGEGVRLRRLYPMLEGQVSILSSGLLDSTGALALLQALRKSPLYRADQKSYLLYPNRELPSFWEKNQVDAASLAELPWLLETLQAGKTDLLTPLPDGKWAFDPACKNGKAVRAYASREAEKQGWSPAQIESLVGLYEDVFNHHEFTGRSGTFFAYEGLGSIYWHMVSKLVLATAETLLDEETGAADADRAYQLRKHFQELKRGLGVHKPVGEHGAIPTDAYSHTPESAGAQQPGMTGQVKEDLLWRALELGLTVREGSIVFQNAFHTQHEALASAKTFAFTAISGAGQTLSVPAGAIAFSFCQVPIILSWEAEQEASIEVHKTDGSSQLIHAAQLPTDLSQSIFHREGQISSLTVTLPRPS